MKRSHLLRWLWASLLTCGTGTGLFALLGAGAPPPAMVVPIHGAIDDTTARLVERSVTQANAGAASAIVLDLNSTSGLHDAAGRIAQAVAASHEPVIAYIDGSAASSAALVALSAPRIVMKPGATIGSAAPVTGDLATTRAAFEAAAARTGRPERLAAAMVDGSVDVPAFKPTGSVLTLDADEAVRARIADATAPTLALAVAQSSAGPSTTVAGYTWWERLMHVAASPAGSALLLTLGLLGLLIEMQTLHGVAGAIGIGSLALFFGSHLYAGFSGPLVVLLAGLGIAAIVWELHVVPGHALPGAIGVTALLVAAILAFGLPFFAVAVEVLATAIVLTAIGFSVAARQFPHNAWATRLALRAAQGADYVTSADLSGLLGRTGTAASFLRPAGIANIDEMRIDVLTGGEFLAAGTPIRVIRVEGSRVFVEAVSLPSYQ